jgi:hypothetical protein
MKPYKLEYSKFENLTDRKPTGTTKQKLKRKVRRKEERKWKKNLKEDQE